MAFQTTPNGIEVVVRGSQESIPVVNVYHVKTPAAVTPEDLHNVVEVFGTWMTGTLLPGLSTTYTLNSITAKDISVEDGMEETIGYTTGNTGSVTGSAVAANAALVVSWRTALTGRSYRGRTYVGGLPQNALADPHNVVTASAAGFAAAFEDLLTAIETAGYVLSVLSRFHNLVKRAAGVLQEIVGLIVDTKLDSQRRRTAN